MSDAEEMKRRINDLENQATIQRILVSEACENLIRYCVENQEKDFLIKGTLINENPFKENKSCVVL